MTSLAPRLKTALTGSAWILPWIFLISHLQVFWRLAPDYQYGWLVLPLAFYLGFRRWPCPNDAKNRGASQLAVVCALLLLPIWWIQAAAPDWSLISYALAGTVIAYTLALVAAHTSWKTAWDLAFPLGFVLCAVPWPQRAETSIIQTLTQLTAAGAVEALQWMGIGAMRQGNLISLDLGTLEISEACCGIRSIQSMLMATLFLGELNRLKLPRRLALIATGLGIALALNLFRNIGLALIASFFGLSTLEQWHDPAGWAILLLSLPLLYLLAWRWRNDPQKKPVPAMDRPTFTMRGILFLGIWFYLVAGGVELWYQAHEWNTPAPRQLNIHWPKKQRAFQFIPVDDRTRDVLLCSNALSASWSKEDDTRWNLTAITWAPRQTSAQFATVHRPEVCLEAAGARFVESKPLLRLPFQGGSLVFEPLEFQTPLGIEYVFFCLFESTDAPAALGQSRWTRVRRAFLGQRNQGEQMVELIVRGSADYQSALESVKTELPGLLSFR